MKRVWLFCVIFLFAVSPAWGTFRLVPFQHLTIQEAINFSSAGDVVIVSPGTYVENLFFRGVDITVTSLDPRNPHVVESTIIDGNFSDSCVTFDSGETNACVLEGFLITHGSGSSNYYERGGGVYVVDSSPTIRYCILTRNGYRDGYYDPELEAYDYYGIVTSRGGGIALEGTCQAVIDHCLIVKNVAQDFGGGVMCRNGNDPSLCRPVISNCTITNNEIGLFDVVHGVQLDARQSQPDIHHCIFYQDDGTDVRVDDPVYMTYSCMATAFESGAYSVYDPSLAGGNIVALPSFDYSGSACVTSCIYGEYLLTVNSPCLDAGDPLYVSSLGETDFEGHDRILHGRVDMGFDEFAARIRVTRPQGGEVWTAGSTHEIRWESYLYNDLVNVELSSDGGGAWQVLAQNQANTGRIVLALPGGLDSSQCLLRVTASSAPSEIILYLSSDVLSIQPFAGLGVPVASVWPTLGNSVSRDGSAANIGPELGCVLWTFDPNASLYQSVTVGMSDRIHVPTENGLLYTLDPNGTLLWSYNVGSRLLSAPAVGLDGSLYVGADDDRLYAFSPDGQLQWTHLIDGFIFSTPAVATDGSIYVGAVDGTLSALQPDGSELWLFDLKLNDPFLFDSILASPSVAVDGTIYTVGLNNPNVYALNAATGAILWETSLGELVDPGDPANQSRFGAQVLASPVIGSDGTIYVGRITSTDLYALNPIDGSIVWQTDMADAANPLFGLDYQAIFASPGVWSEPALGSDGTIYVTLDDPYLRAVSPAGQIQWITPLGAIGGFTLTVGADDLIYAASEDNSLYIVSPQGDVLAHFDGGGRLGYPVIAADGTLYLSEGTDLGNTGRVWAIRLSGCQPQAALDLHHPTDLNGDGISDLLDLDLFVQQWLASSGDPFDMPPSYLPGDIDRNLFVDLFDFQELSDYWMMP